MLTRIIIKTFDSSSELNTDFKVSLVNAYIGCIN